MVLNVGINGLGRIGKNVLRSIWEYSNHDINLTQINCSSSLDDLIRQIKYDSVHGIFPYKVEKFEHGLIIEGKKILVTAERNIDKLVWHDCDIVFECTGNFNNKEQAAKHLKNQVKKVIVSAPCVGADATIVYGVNNHILKGHEQVISIGSCTTNALAPLVQILNNHLTIVSGFMTTIHAYTNDQRILDGNHKDPRRARACALSMIPTSTGAAKTIGLILPELAGKLDGAAIRVPTPNVSLIDLTFTSNKATNIEEINNLIKHEADLNYKKILSIASDQLVSIDFNHQNFSSIFDPFETKVVNNNLCRIVAWYDNEWGFSSRMIDVARLVS